MQMQITMQLVLPYNKRFSLLSPLQKEIEEIVSHSFDVLQLFESRLSESVDRNSSPFLCQSSLGNGQLEFPK